MFVWIMTNSGTLITLLILVAVVIFIIKVMIRDKKQGKSSCGGNCAHCKMCTACKSVKNGDTKCKKTI